jgi:hypothetical protein
MNFNGFGIRRNEIMFGIRLRISSLAFTAFSPFKRIGDFNL